MDCLKNEERRIIPPEALFLLLGEVWSQFSSLARELWLSEGDAIPFPFVIFWRILLYCSASIPLQLQLLCCSEHKLLQLVASKNSKVYNSSHAGMQHCKLGFGCSYHVSTEKVALIVIIAWGNLDETWAKFGVIGFTFCSDWNSCEHTSDIVFPWTLSTM
jgi:hypothetical protein